RSAPTSTSTADCSARYGPIGPFWSVLSSSALCPYPSCSPPARAVRREEQCHDPTAPLRHQPLPPIAQRATALLAPFGQYFPRQPYVHTLRAAHSVAPENRCR